MTAEDPLLVQFRLPDEQTARHLDRMIHDAGGDPDRWLVDVVEADRELHRAEAPARLARLAELVSQNIDHAAVAAWDGKPPPIDPNNRRPRRPKPSSAWRTKE